jgi:hypothetical protein
MAILNYTTQISATKTVGEIQQLLVSAGCQKVLVDYLDRQPTALTFMIQVQGQPVYFTLPANVEGVRKALVADVMVKRHYQTTDQARRVTWRIIKNWCEAQLALIEAGQAQLAEVFLPYAQTASGQTLFRALETGGFKLLN